MREGAEVYGYAKQPPTDPSMFGLCGLKTEMESIEGDVRDLDALRSVFSPCETRVCGAYGSTADCA